MIPLHGVTQTICKNDRQNTLSRFFDDSRAGGKCHREKTHWHIIYVVRKNGCIIFFSDFKKGTSVFLWVYHYYIRDSLENYWMDWHKTFTLESWFSRNYLCRWSFLKYEWTTFHYPRFTELSYGVRKHFNFERIIY